MQGVWDGFNTYIVRCADFGQYTSEVIKYAKKGGINLYETIETGKEPWLFLITTPLNYIATFQDRANYVVVDLLIRLLTLLLFFILVKRVTWSATIAIIGLIIIATGFLWNTGVYILTTRQSLCNFLLLIFASTPFFTKSIWTKRTIMGIILAWVLFSHRIWILFIGLWSVLLALYYIVTKKYKEFKEMIIVILIGILLSLPFLLMFYESAVNSFSEYLNRYIRISQGTQEILFESSISNIGWVSFLRWINQSAMIPIWEYILYQSHMFIFLLCIIDRKRIWILLSVNPIFFTMVLAIFLYICGNFIFWTRILTTFEIFIAAFAFLVTTKSIMKRRSFLFIIIIAINIISLSNKITNPRIFKLDSSIIALKEIIKTENTFIIWPHCIQDLWAQLWYQSAPSYSWLKMVNIKDQRDAWVLTYNELEWWSTTLSNSIFTKPYLPELLKEKDIYIIFGTRFGQNLSELNSKSEKYFKSPYVDLVYRNTSSGDVIKYIFKVKNKEITYFEGKSYIDRTLILPK